MFQKISLSWKIFLGFSSILVLAVALGSVALQNMKRIEDLSLKLDREYVPEVNVANNLERYSLRTMREMRGYGLIQDDSYLEAAIQNLNEVKKYLEEAAKLSSKVPDLVLLQKRIGMAEAKIREFEELVNRTVARNGDISKIRKAMDEAGKRFLKSAVEYQDGQKLQMKQEIEDSLPPERLLQRFGKLQEISEIIELGNAIAIANFRSQATRDPRFVDEVMKNFVEMAGKLEEIKSRTVLEHNKRYLGEIGDAAAAYKGAIQDLLSTWQELRNINTLRDETGDRVVSAARETSTSGIKQTGEAAETAVSALSSASRILIIGLAIVILLGIGMAYLIGRSIVRPIHVVVSGLAEGADQVASAAGQLSGASQQLAEGASEQAAAIEETSSSLEEMSSMTKLNSQHTGLANNLMAETADVLVKANRSMDRLTSSMLEISAASEETSKIIKTIDGIAFQTNLLALNAAVEAARAGEAGAGFAVVADEVRNLAVRAAEAAKNTSNLLEGTVKKVKEGSELVDETSSGFSQAASMAERMSKLIGEISAASAEQAQGIEQINKAVSEMDKVVQQNASSAEESASASEEMNAQAVSMKSFVNQLLAVVGGAAGKAAINSGHAAAQKDPKAAGSLKSFFTKPEDVIPFDFEEMPVDI